MVNNRSNLLVEYIKDKEDVCNLYETNFCLRFLAMKFYESYIFNRHVMEFVATLTQNSIVKNSK